MPKTGLKTFVYSFSVSLFAICAANGIYWHNRPLPSSDIKIPSKNVMLFLQAEPANPSKLAAPIKKIALNVLPEIKAQQEALSVEDEIIMAENFDIPEIPLEIEVPSLEAEAVALPKALPAPQTPPMMLAENAVPKPQPIQQEEVKKPEKITIPLQIPTAAGSTKPKAETSPPKPVEQTIAAKPVILAQADNEPIPLLPLERSGDALAQNTNKVKVGTLQNLNQVALVDSSIPIRSMEEPSLAKPAAVTTPPPAWENMADKTSSDESPWLVAKADGALRNQKVADEGYYQKENAAINQALHPQIQTSSGVKVAGDTVKNLLIPIPEDILNDDNLTPQLSFSATGKPEDSVADKPAATTPEKPSVVNVAVAEAPQMAKPTEQETQKSKLLSSLNSIFSTDTKVKEETAADKKETSILADIRKKIKNAGSRPKIMPTEMRLSFQPNRAEISGQTLRWIQAFAAKAAEDNSMAIEIRIDGTSAMDLQQKRLNLLHNILTNKGVEYSKINTVFTQREPNSFIIKTVTRNNFNQKGTIENVNKATAGYYQQW